MVQHHLTQKPPGFTRGHDPRHIGEIINDFLRSDSPLAKGYRQFLASSEIVAEKGDKE